MQTQKLHILAAPVIMQITQSKGLSIGFAAILLPICCVLADQILPLPTNQVIIGVAAPQPLRTEAPEIPGLDR